jgi:hypothetical protein
MAVTERGGRKVCWALAGIDLVLGGGAVLFPDTYLTVVHPHLPADDHPEDWVVRTGVVWLMFLAVEFCAARSAKPAKWFFAVALLRLIEVPADIAYGVVARGMSEASRLAVFAAPVANGLAGVYLMAAHRRLAPDLSRTRRPPSGPREM